MFILPSPYAVNCASAQASWPVVAVLERRRSELFLQPLEEHDGEQEGEYHDGQGDFGQEYHTIPSSIVMSS